MGSPLKQQLKRLPGMRAVRARRWARRGLHLPVDSRLPARVDPTLVPETMDYWGARLVQTGMESYRGVPMWKFPEDLWIYQHLLWLDRVDTVIEIGTRAGGSALWFRDTLASMVRYGHIRRPRVVTIDLDTAPVHDGLLKADPEHEGIEIVEGNGADPGLPGEIERLIDGDARCFVVDDSAHDYETTLAVLRGFSRFVEPGGFMVVEDGVVDVEELRSRVSDKTWARGVLPALNDWLRSPEGSDFRVRPDLELYGITCSPSGFLQRHPTQVSEG